MPIEQRHVADQAPPEVMLCQDCLRVRPFTVAGHLGEELCECNGEYCGCESCVNTAVLLRNGERRKSVLGTVRDVVEWTEESGEKRD